LTLPSDTGENALATNGIQDMLSVQLSLGFGLEVRVPSEDGFPQARAEAGSRK